MSVSYTHLDVYKRQMIYCSSTPSTPFSNDAEGNGVAWANSLFEDNAEYGYGMALAQNFKE